MKLLTQTAGLPPASSLLEPDRRQATLVALAVLLAHAGLLAWLQTGTGPVQPPQLATVVTMELLASSPAPAQASKPVPQPEPRQPAKPKPAPRPAQQPASKPLPKPSAVTQAEPSPLPASATSVTPAAASGTTAAAPAASATAATGTASPSPARVELPSASADYLNNPKPAYPPLSRRLREEGKVVLRVLIGTDGTAEQAEIRSSSGYERLDQAALQTVLRWRYVPARRNGVPEAMWFNVPINFVLE
jgi:periplasmic protein TonB